MHRFSEIGRRAPSPEAQSDDTPSIVDPAAPYASSQSGQIAARAPEASMAASARLSSLPVGEARRRIDALLRAQGFNPEDAAAAGGDYTITATRMAVARGLPDEAQCRLKALNRPQMYAATVTVRLAPTAAGVQVGVQARFEEMDQNLVSGDLSKYPCRSRGLLEAQVRRAARGG